MKQNVNPGVVIGVIVVGVLLLAFIAWRAFVGSSSTPAASAVSAGTARVNPITGGASSSDMTDPRMAAREEQMKKIDANRQMHQPR